MMAKKIKPPRPPMCLCRTLADWLLGIMSPSLVLMVDSEETRRYWNAVYEYKQRVFMDKLRKRNLSKEEWKDWYRNKRRRKRKI